MTLTYETQVRREDDTEVIANLLRKGWIENEPPSHDPATQQAPTWDGVQWTIASLSAEEIAAQLAAQYPPATKLQARVWLIRNGIDPANVPAIIEDSFPPGPERLEALERWHSAEKIPFDHPLVGVIAASLNLDPAAIWAEVLAIK